MAYKFKTAGETERILSDLEIKENLPWPTLIKLSLSLSIKGDPLTDSDFLTDSTGRELNRPTATGEFDVIYKCLIELREKRHLTDDEYFPKYVKAHLDRGAVYLEREKKYAKDLLVHLSELDKSI